MIYRYLISSRAYVCKHFFINFFTTLSTSWVQTNRINIWLSLLSLALAFQCHNLIYLVNSYVDYINKVDDRLKSKDRTLFDYIDINTLLDYIKHTLLSIFCILMVVCYFYQWSTSKVIIQFVVFQLICASTYTHGKYIGVGQLIFGVFHWSFMSLYYFSATGNLVICNSKEPITYYSISVSIAILQALHGNYHRDFETDSKANIKTLAILLGKENSLYFYTGVFITYCLYSIVLINRLKNPLFISLLVRASYGETQMLNMKTIRIYYLSYYLMIISILLGGKKVII
ncbi:hypothetical protein DICPUDRAFT_41654 [Dictyostelium purpureum]|uniref:UbiA prenyltransferase family protein n=1 Tax=Dictyostelium purpureum TaxID=5786 RepID=F1A0H6_DICPU|nr:uncharacterized protein DICPUDRAFT_41654 [Dictyostelium purpureum]EGC30291.1 hypothetical protein DICPUDRAFT_41654 [Dictyostelium purpureum]|eukprot:XP_003293170.1 hypothetical protein DICPUDRAFT_41654 [Dictyostelium purpureum]